MAPIWGELLRYRGEEQEHAAWLESQVRELGGDAEAMTSGAALVQTESLGFEAVVKNDDQLPHVMHALLAAELVDNAGWELLIELADDADDTEARKEFRKRLHEEEDHLIFIRTATLALARKDILGYTRRYATAPE